MRTILILVVGLGGLWLSFRHLQKNLKDIRAKAKAGTSAGDRAMNYPMMVLWFGYLLVFFGGLIVNNLILR